MRAKETSITLTNKKNSMSNYQVDYPTRPKKKKNNKWLVTTLLFIILFLLASICANGYCIYKVHQVQAEYSDMMVAVEESKEANQKVLEILTQVRDTQKEQDTILRQTAAVKIARKETINLLKTNGISTYTDLGECTTLTAEDMDKIIDYYDAKTGGSTFKGKGYVFVQAAKESGLNPIYIFAHAAIESAFGNSYLARTQHNYFGINAVDTDPGQAYVMGDSIDQGIINGALWIKRNYYDQGYKTLADMKAAGYATDPSWATAIAGLANSSVKLL